MNMTGKEVLDIFNFRFAAKEFNGNIVPDSDMEIIAQTARLSPSSFGLEPWKFIVVSNKEIMKEISEVSWGFQRQQPTTSHIIIALTKQGKEVRFDSEYMRNLWLNTKGVTEEFFDGLMPILGGFQKANLDIDNTDIHLLEWSKRQAYIAMGNMMTGAAMMGIDSCAIEGFDRQKVEEILVKKGLLDKAEYDLTYFIAFGYRAEEPKREKSRRESKDVIAWAK